MTMSPSFSLRPSVHRKATNLTIRSVLVDPVSGSILKTSAGNVYRVGPYAKIKKIEFGVFRHGEFGALINQTPPLEAGVPFHQQLLAGGGYRKAIAVTYDFEPRDRNCELRLIRGHTKVGGRTRVFRVGEPSYSPEGDKTLRPGLDQRAFIFDPFEDIDEPPDDVEFLEFGVGMYEDFTELSLRFLTASEILRMPINCLRIVGEAIPEPDATLVAGRPVKFSVPLELPIDTRAKFYRLIRR